MIFFVIVDEHAEAAAADPPGGRILRRPDGSPLVKVLARHPGTKESRYLHLLSGDVEPVSSSAVHETPAVAGRDNADKVSRLESEVAELRKDILDLKQQFAAFRKQFE